jgi:pimeloyl-ACP methyl ester carboxylesterase
MRYWLLIFILSAHTGFTQSVMVDGRKMAYKSFGLENRKPGEPVLVFESGMGSGGGAYEMLFPALSKKAAGIAYDRNGLGGSDIDTTIKSDRDVVTRLHDVLKALQIEPPYLLVGHSLGGPFIRLFTSVYPKDVSGLVFIDPTDFMLTAKEDEEIRQFSGSAMGYRELLAHMQERAFADTTLRAGERYEMKRVRNTGYFEEYTSLPSLPDIPVTVLISYNRPIELQEKELARELNINIVPWFKEVNRFRIQHFAAMIANNHNSSMILLPGYSHGIHHQDPALGAAVILDLYNKVIAKSSNK